MRDFLGQLKTGDHLPHCKIVREGRALVRAVETRLQEAIKSGEKNPKLTATEMLHVSVALQNTRDAWVGLDNARGPAGSMQLLLAHLNVSFSFLCENDEKFAYRLKSYGHSLRASQFYDSSLTVRTSALDLASGITEAQLCCEIGFVLSEMKRFVAVTS